MLVFVNKIKNLNNQMNVKSSYFTPIGGILLNYSGGILFKYYLHRKIASIHFLQPDFVIRKRISNNNSVISGNQNDALKKLHEFGCGIGIAFADRFKIHFKIGDKH